ncbi:hypothetical protein V8E52_010295 [Russula decolorans]
MSFRVRKRFIRPLSLFLNAAISWLSLATRCDLDTENISKITAILYHVDISLKEVNHIRTITNELGTHGLIYYDYLPRLALGLLGVITILFFLFKTFASVLLTQKAKRLHQSNPKKNKDLRQQSKHVFGQWSRGTRGHWLPRIHVLYAFQILQPLAPCQPSVIRDPQNVPVMLARCHRSPVCQARMDIGV